MTRSILWTAALCVALVAAPGWAQTPRKFAVLSLIGDSLLIVNHAGDAETRTVLYLPEHAFDNTVAADIERAVRQASPGSPVVKLAGAQPLYAREGDDALDDPDPRSVLAAVQPVIAKGGVTHLVLVTKLRRPANVVYGPKPREEKLDGLGFFVDAPAARAPADAKAPDGKPATAKQEGGYLAPFAVFRVFLVDVPHERIVGYRDVSEMSPASRGGEATAQVWQSLSSSEKVQIMHSLVQKGAQDAARELVSNLPD